MQINTVEPDRGFPPQVPTNITIASTVILRDLVSTVMSSVLATFPMPATLVDSRQYAIVVSQPSGNAGFSVNYHDPGICPEGEPSMVAGRAFSIR